MSVETEYDIPTEFIHSLKHPLKQQIMSILNSLDVVVVGEVVCNKTLMDDLTQYHYFTERARDRYSFNEEEWINERLQDEFDKPWDGKLPILKQQNVEFNSSEIWKVSPQIVKIVDGLLNSLDALVVCDRVYVGSFLKEHSEFTYDYQVSSFWDYEQQIFEDNNNDD